MKTYPKPEPCDKRPKGCKCDPKSWDGYWAICPKCEPGRFQDGRCAICEHDEACHTKTTMDKRTGGFLDLALALYLAAMAVAPFALAIVLDAADSLPKADYPASIYNH